MTKSRRIALLIVGIAVVSSVMVILYGPSNPSMRKKRFTENDFYLSLGLEDVTIEENQTTILSIYLLDDTIRNTFDNLKGIGYKFQKSDHVTFINGSKKRSYYEENIVEYRQETTAKLPPGKKRAKFEITVIMTYENMVVETDTIGLEVI